MSRKTDETRTKSSRTLHWGKAAVDLDTGQVRAADGSMATLRHQSVQVLCALAARQGEVVSKEELFAGVWPGIAVTDDSLVQCVADIRRALGEGGHGLLQTVPKRGYRLVLGVEEVDDEDVAQPRSEGRSLPMLAAAALAVLVVTGLVASSLRPASSPEGLPSIAVLPFENLSGEARWERLGRGLAAEIGADLARSRGVLVIPAETVEGGASEPSAAAEVLGARFVLDGTIQADADVLRITAHLLDGEEGTVIWSDRWARPSDDVFAVQDEIVARIGGTLDGTWTGALARAVRERARERPERSLEAYELFLLGSELKHRHTPEGFDAAVPLLRRALEIDPNFVPAMVALSVTLSFQADYAESEAAALLTGEALALLERAIEIDPNNPNALSYLTCRRVFEDQRSEAWPLAARAVEIAPINPDVLALAAACYPYADHGRAPLEWAERAITLNPGHPEWYNLALSLAALFAGDLELARRAGREAPPLPDILITMGAAEALAGNIKEARAWFDRFEAETRYRHLSAYYSMDDMAADPALAPWVEGARLAGFPVTAVEAETLAAR